MSSTAIDNNNDIFGINVYKTSQLFQDPVRAQDGYTYERENITIWIEQNSTSPFTGKPLVIDELEHDDSFKLLQPVQPTVTTDFRIPMVPILHRYHDEEHSEHMKHQSSDGCKAIVIFLICLIIIALGVFLGFAWYNSDLLNNIIETNVKSRYTGSVTETSPTYSIDRADNHGHETMIYKHKKTLVRIPKQGMYSFECTLDDLLPFAYIGTIDLYVNSFDPGNVLANRVQYMDRDEGIHRSSFNASLQSGDYILVTSMINGNERSFSISVTGPDRVIFS